MYTYNPKQDSAYIVRTLISLLTYITRWALTIESPNLVSTNSTVEARQ